jgi:3-methyladenine DNA glycosylase AlkD
MKAEDVKLALQGLADPSRATSLARYFKAGHGQYGEGDRFIGVTVPEQRKVTAVFKELLLPEVIKLLRSSVHEHRLTALFILVDQYRKGDKQTKKQIAGLYHKNRTYVNNWDLVDSSAPYILGDYLKTHSPNVLFHLAAYRWFTDIDQEFTSQARLHQCSFFAPRLDSYFNIHLITIPQQGLAVKL